MSGRTLRLSILILHFARLSEIPATAIVNPSTKARHFTVDSERIFPPFAEPLISGPAQLLVANHAHSIPIITQQQPNMRRCGSCRWAQSDRYDASAWFRMIDEFGCSADTTIRCPPP